MEHGRHAQLTVQAFGIGTEGAQGRPHRLKQQVIDLLGMDLDPAVEDVREGEDQMVIGHRQGGGALTLAPVLRGAALAARAVAVTTGVVEEGALPAGITFQGEAAQGGGAAVQKVVTDLPVARAQWVVRGVVRQAGADDGLDHKSDHPRV